MALWVDKHRPDSIDRLDFHDEVSKRLSSLAKSGELPHLLFYGPSGAGKKTRILSTLRELYGPSAEKLTIQHRAFTTPTGRKLELHTVSSHYHVEMTPSDVGNQDRFVVQEIIKEIAQTQQVDSTATRKFKVVVIHEADKLSKQAQQGLRRTMEKYMGNLRLIFCCESTGKIMAPIRSRCLLIRIAAPSIEEMVDIMKKVMNHEAPNHRFNNTIFEQIATQSNRNLRKALLMLEATHVQTPTSCPDTKDIPTSDWEVFVRQIAMMMIEEQSPARILLIRTKLYELLAHCIPADMILKTLVFELIKHVDSNIKTEIIRQAAFYDHRLRLGSKEIYHLEAFVAKFMSVYKRFLMELYA